MQRRTFLEAAAATVAIGTAACMHPADALAGDVPLARAYRAPELAEIEKFFHTKASSLREFLGQVVALHFWTYSCSNCLANLPHYARWHHDFAAAGLVVLGVHTPEFSEEAKIENVAEQLQALKIEYPVAIDNQFATWKQWKNRYWPTVHLIDRRGDVRATWIGELNWKASRGEVTMRSRIEALLKEQRDS